MRYIELFEVDKRVKPRDGGDTVRLDRKDFQICEGGHILVIISSGGGEEEGSNPYLDLGNLILAQPKLL